MIDPQKKHLLITVGRQFGSGGYSVAKSIGERLGIKAYDKELLSAAAEESGFSRSIFERKDEKHSLFSMSNILSTVQNMGGPRSYMDDGSIHHIQALVIRSIAERESAVFVGRASDFVLKDMHPLNVFITADMQDRLQRVSEREGISEDEAASLIAKRDKERASFYNFLTLGDWGVAGTYDLCVNSSHLGIEGTAELIIEFAKLTRQP